MTRRELATSLGLVFVVTAAAAGRTHPHRQAPPAFVVQKGTIDATGGPLYFEVSGNGPAVVLIHGSGFDHRMWDDQVSALAAEYRVIRYDVRGFGKSPLTRAGYRNADDLNDLLTALHVDKAVLIGQSLGGRIALDYALAHPERVRALVPVATGVSGYDSSDEVRARLVAVMAAAFSQGPPRAAQLWLDDPLFREARKNPQLHLHLLEMAAANGDSWRANPPADNWPPALDRLSSIHAPTLVVVGNKDIPDIQEIADIVAREVPGAHKVVVPDTDHALTFERPVEFHRLLAEFLHTVH